MSVDDPCMPPMIGCLSMTTSRWPRGQPRLATARSVTVTFAPTTRLAGARPSAGAPTGRGSGDGGWKWKGLELGPEANRVADEGLAVRRAAEGRDAEGSYGEGGLTPAMRRVEAELTHGTLVPDTEKLALKSPDRFKEKLARMIERYPVSHAVSMSRRSTTESAIRSCFQPGLLGRGGRRRTQALRDRGYNLRKESPGGTRRIQGRQQPMARSRQRGPVRGPVPHAGELGRQAADTRHL